MGHSTNNIKEQNLKKLIILLLLITLIAVCITVWALFFRDTSIPLIPDYAPLETEKHAESIGDDSTGKTDVSHGGGSVSLSYSNQVAIDLSDETVSLLFANPSKSTQDMVLQIVIQGTVVIQSGTLSPGKQVTTLDLPDRTARQLSVGSYDGKFVVFYYDTVTGEKAVINTEIPITITVHE